MWVFPLYKFVGADHTKASTVLEEEPPGGRRSNKLIFLKLIPTGDWNKQPKQPLTDVPAVHSKRTTVTILSIT